MLDFYKNNKLKNAFTMVEIMITLLIVGVVAGITLPNLFQKVNEQNTVKKVQKAYSVLSQAYLYASDEYGTPGNWGVRTRDIANSVIIRDKLLSKIKYTNKCEDSSDQTKCGVAKKYKYCEKCTTYSPDFLPKNSSSALIADGMGVMFMTDYVEIKDGDNIRGTIPALHTIGWILVDVNGAKLPNVLGKDMHAFYLSDVGITPQGLPQEVGGRFSYNVNTTCRSKGLGCTGWVIKEKNMNYLHSSKCSWTNTSCK